MLSEISISKGVDCMELCDVIRENFTTYISNKNIHIINGSKNLFIGCICGVEVPQ
jgi:alanine-alpha-ketoisovalerate/valine-pyruvate aminotransferase